MASFDAIEFFGVGQGRHSAIRERPRVRSQSSISLSSTTSRLDAAVDEDASNTRPFTPVQQTTLTRAPVSPSHSFINITPENSIFGLTFGLPTSAAASPNVSTNSSWIPDAHQPSSLERYLHNHERHEQISISMGPAPNYCQERDAGDFNDTLNALLDAKVSPFPRHPSQHSDVPLHRYLTDVEPHEQLAVALEQHDQGWSEGNIESSVERRQKTPSSISLSADPEARDDDEVMVRVGEEAAQFRERRKVCEASRPRLYKAKLTRKRRSESPQQGRKEKAARWSWARRRR